MSATARPPDADATYFRALLESASYAIAIVDPAGVSMHWNSGALALFGYSLAEVSGKNLSLLSHEQDQTLAALPGRVATEGVVELELKLRRKDGSSVDVQLLAAAASGAAGAVREIAIVFKDTSSFRSLEHRLPSFGQTQALARAATVFASELNNVLTIVSTYQGFVADAQLSLSQARDLKVAQDAVERGAALVDQLLAVNRWGEGALAVFDLNDVARGVEDLLRRLVGGRVSLLLVGAPSRLAVHAGAGQIEQLLINLALNARDAMPAGGLLSVSLRNAAVGPGHPLLGQLKRGPYAVLSAKDTGSGIDAATLPHIFTPFFSTHASGGTGLGLSIVKSIVAGLGGAIQIETEPGRGSIFEVFLPIFDRPPQAASVLPEARRADRPTLLIVDEDVSIRAALERILSPDFAVLLAADWTEAASVARRTSSLDLVVCDLRLAREDELQTLTKIRSARPKLEVLYVSEQPATAGLELAEPGDHVIRKPFAPDAVTAAVRRALERGESGADAESRRPAVLIVDDNVDFCDILVEALSTSELELFAAKSGLHAIQLLEQRHIDLVVSDQMMPGMDGVRLLEVVRDRWPECQRVLLTGHASSDVLLGAVNRGGANKVLIKTMNPLAIREEIERAAFAGRKLGAQPL